LVALVNVNIRTGPGLNYPIIGSLRQGNRATIMGRLADRSWWRIQCSSGDAASHCWVSGDPTLTRAANTDSVAVAVAPPAPASVATATIAATAPPPPTGSAPTATPTATPAQIGMMQPGYTPVPSSAVAAQLDFTTPAFSVCYCQAGNSFGDPEIYFVGEDHTKKLTTLSVAEGFSICAANFESGQNLQIQFLTPGGTLYQTYSSLVTFFDEEVEEGDRCGKYIRLNAELGTYTIVATQETTQVTSTFTVARPATPVIFSKTRSGNAGSIFEFSLAGFDSNTPLYLYRSAICERGSCGEYLGQLPPPQLNARGEGTYFLPTQVNDLPGNYFLVAPPIRCDPDFDSNTDGKDCLDQYQQIVQGFEIRN
jgi:uncharacterized protein YraI